jgi:hypothetical protein
VAGDAKHNSTLTVGLHRQSLPQLRRCLGLSPPAWLSFLTDSIVITLIAFMHWLQLPQGLLLDSLSHRLGRLKLALAELPER